MGITISYRGRLRQAADIQPLTEELTDICRSAGWKFQVIDMPNPEPCDQPFSGITFQPHLKSESVWMLFNQKGELYHPWAADLEDGSLPWSWTKTQFAGPATHKAICDLLRFVEGKWFEVFEVKDEAEYWETGNEQLLQEKFDFLTDAIRFMEDSINSLPEDEVSLEKIKEIAEQFGLRRQPPGKK